MKKCKKDCSSDPALMCGDCYYDHITEDTRLNVYSISLSETQRLIAKLAASLAIKDGQGYNVSASASVTKAIEILQEVNRQTKNGE